MLDDRGHEIKKTEEEPKSWIPDDIDIEKDGLALLVTHEKYPPFILKHGVPPDVLRDMLIGVVLDMLIGSISVSAAHATLAVVKEHGKKAKEAALNQAILRETGL